MTPERWKQIKHVFQLAIERPPTERVAFLDQACASSPDLRSEVEALIYSHEQADDSIEAMAGEVAAAMLACDQPGPLTGRRLGPYQIINRIGQGGMGEVYLAQDMRLGRKVALKLLPAEFTTDAERVRRFAQEARTASALNHPNIVTIYDIGEVANTHYIVEEFIDGETLRQRMTDAPQRRMELSEALDVAAQIATALAAAHEAGIAHRDVKPENIMLRPDGLVKVLDFGLAKLTEPSTPAIDTQASTTAGASTESGVVMGTPRYMSPEQARGLKVDHRADIFSLGVMVYELVAGRRPFEGETASDVIAAILREEPAPLAQYAPEIPAKLQRIVGKALVKDREERYQTSLDLLSDLRSLKQETESGAAAVDRKLRLGVLKSRIPLVAALVILMIAAVVYALFFRSAKNAPPSEIKSLAVLPLKSIGGQAGEDYLALGIADTIITKVSQIGELRVRPTSAVRKYSNQEIDSREAARQLQADAALELSVQRAGDRLRVNVNLLRVADDASLWTSSFNVNLADIFAVQDEVSRQVASRLRFQLTPTEAARLARRYTSSPQAYEYYLKGIYSLDKGRAELYSRTDIETAIAMFKQAVEVDPKYALARAQLAEAYAWMAVHVDPGNKVWLERAREESDQAGDLDPQLAEVHVARSELLWSAHEGYQIEEAVRELRLALQLNPSAGREQLATLYFHLGLEEQSLRELQRVLETDPTNETAQVRLARAYEDLGRNDEAIAAHQRFFNRPGPVWAHLRKNQLSEAQKVIEWRLARNPNAPMALSGQALLLALQGKVQEVEAEIPVVMKNAQYNRGAHHYTYDIAAMYALQGKSQKAIEWLKRTVELGMPNYLLFVRDPHLDRIRKEPAFIRFMNELKARWDGYQREFR